MAVMIVNFSRAMHIELPSTRRAVVFQDHSSISGYALSSIDVCVRAGIMEGSGANFLPRDPTRRCEAAQMFSNFLNRSRPASYNIIRKSVDGTAVSAVEFDPASYTADVVMGGNRVRGAEGIQSIASRTGAQIAVNGGFFDLDSYDPYGTIVRNGEPVTIYNEYSPQKTSIVMDSTGRFSIENFTTRITLTIYNEGEKEQKAEMVAVNRLPGSTDGTRVIFTKDWGSKLGFQAKYAAVVDRDGFVTQVYEDEDAEIPEEGYLIVQRVDRQYGNEFIRSAKVGAYVYREIVYDGSQTQDIQLCLAVGPKLVENGMAYGDSGTYAAEGLNNINNLGNEYRVCFGVKDDGSLLILTAKTSLPDLSNIMVSMGCQSAVNLDGGGSANLYVGGSYLTGPRERPMNNVLVFR